MLNAYQILHKCPLTNPPKQNLKKKKQKSGVIFCCVDYQQIYINNLCSFQCCK